MSKEKPTLLFYCQHSLGMGHLIRATNLVYRLADEFRVTFLNGGPLPDELRLPAGIELVNVPPLGMDRDSALISRMDGLGVDASRGLRKSLILETLQRVQPQVLVIELFPFGRKKFAFELLPLLKSALRMPHAPRIYCSLRDIMVGGRKDQLRHDNRAAWLINRYFDAVLLHADPAFIRLRESFSPTLPLRKPVFYTGFVGPRIARVEQQQRDRRVVVSAGGGIVGGELFRAAVTAQHLLWTRLGMPMDLVAGPFLPEPEWQDLQVRAEGVPGLTLYRQVPGLAERFCNAACSVSQCGYNTAMDLVATQIPALVVPFSEGAKDEQLNRARRLERLGLVRVLAPALLEAERLADEIVALLDFRPRAGALSLDGATRSSAILAEMMARSGVAADEFVHDLASSA